MSFIHGITLLQLPKDPLLLIFGYWDKQLLMWSSKANFQHLDWILIYLLVARRSILKNWVSSHFPKILQIKRELLLSLYKDKINTDFNHKASSKHLYLRWCAFPDSTLSHEELKTFESSFSYYKGLPMFYDKDDTS